MQEPGMQVPEGAFPLRDLSFPTQVCTESETVAGLCLLAAHCRGPSKAAIRTAECLSLRRLALSRVSVRNLSDAFCAEICVETQQQEGEE